jgi:hypothetical protein
VEEVAADRRAWLAYLGEGLPGHLTAAPALHGGPRGDAARMGEGAVSGRARQGWARKAVTVSGERGGCGVLGFGCWERQD